MVSECTLAAQTVVAHQVSSAPSCNRNSQPSPNAQVRFMIRPAPAARAVGRSAAATPESSHSAVAPQGPARP